MIFISRNFKSCRECVFLFKSFFFHFSAVSFSHTHAHTHIRVDAPQKRPLNDVPNSICSISAGDSDDKIQFLMVRLAFVFRPWCDRVHLHTQ